MQVRLLAILCLCALVATGLTKKVKTKSDDLEDTYGNLSDAEKDVQNDEFEEYGVEEGQDTTDTDNDDDIQVEIKTKPQVFPKTIGETVMLPCEITNDAVVVIWRKGTSSILVQGHIPMGTFENINEFSNNTLAVRLEKDSDFDDYTCQVMIGEHNNPTIVHKVVKISPPKITNLTTAENKTVYQVGESMTLVCLAEGYPTPEISWYKGNTEGERLGLKGSHLTIEKVTFKTAGFYRCLADNKNKPANHKFIEINVEHKPIIQIEKYLVNSDKENDAELKCTVRGYPQATVLWKKNGKTIANQPPKIILKKNRDNIENILTITNLKEEDFGVYTCSAANRLDTVEKSVNLIKTPAVQDFLKPEKNLKDVVLTWKVESKAPISRHELQYRKKGEDQWQNIEPEVTNGEQDVYTVKYEIKNLDGGNYETRLRSENVHGWSEYSPIMTFESVLAKHGSTHKNHNKKHHHKEKEIKEKNLTPTQEGTPAQHQEIESKESPVGASQHSGCGLVSSSAYLISISLFAFFFRRQ